MGVCKTRVVPDLAQVGQGSSGCWCYNRLTVSKQQKWVK